MTEPFVNALLRRSGLRNKSQQPASSFGARIGLIDQADTYCWNLVGELRIQFDQHLCPAIRRHLEFYFESEHVGECLTVDAYLIGKSQKYAKPTVLFISRCAQTRKSAQKEIKQSGLLSDYPDFTTAVIAKDPGLAAVSAHQSSSHSEPQTMEVLATQRNSFGNEPGESLVDIKTSISLRRSSGITSPPTTGVKTAKAPGSVPGAAAAARVLYDPNKGLRIRGQPIYIENGSELRMATANVVQIGSRVLLQTVHHAFSAPTLHDAEVPVSEPNNGFEMDTDDDEDEDERISNEESSVETTSRGSRSPESSTADCSTSDDDGTTLSDRSEEPSDASVASSAAKVDHGAYGQDIRPPEPSRIGSRTRSSSLPSIHTFDLLGTLWRSSIDSDWALIELTDAALAFYQPMLADNSAALFPIMNEPSAPPTAVTNVITWTATGDLLRGELSGSTWIMFPGTSVFREVYQVHIMGSLLHGDCGSVVLDATSGIFYGYIVAGSTSTSVAYVMAAHQIAADLRTVVEEDLMDHKVKNTDAMWPSSEDYMSKYPSLWLSASTPWSSRLSNFSDRSSLSSHSSLAPSSRFSTYSRGRSSVATSVASCSDLHPLDNENIEMQGQTSILPPRRRGTGVVRKDRYETCVSRKHRARRSNAMQKYFCTACQEPFQEKADWKRHEETFQERPEQYDCDCCEAIYFQSRDFVHHHVHGHGCIPCSMSSKHSENSHVLQARRQRNVRTGCGCGFCYHYSDNWTERCNHVAFHFEEGKNIVAWNHSVVIYSLLQRPHINAAWNTILQNLRDTKSILGFGWDSKTTGRAEGYPDHKTTAQLQDMLEYFTPDQDAGALAKLAFDCSVKQFEAQPPPPPPKPEEIIRETHSWSQFVRSVIAEDYQITGVSDPEHGASWFDDHGFL